MSKDSHGATEMSVRTVVVAGSAELAAELKDVAGPGNSAVTGAAAAPAAAAAAAAAATVPTARCGDDSQWWEVVAGP